MSFVSLKFIIFFVFVLIIGSLIQKKKDYKIFLIFLLMSNFIFYSFGNYRVSILLFLTIIIEFICARNCNKKAYYYLGIIFPLVLLAFFKYTNFFLETFKFDSLNIIVPLGISFYTFELISYIVDVRNNKIEVESDFIRFATYISFFPNLLSGPIERAGNLLTQLREKRTINLEDFKVGIQIIAIGYFKKMVLADRLNVFVNDVFNYPKSLHWLTIVLGIVSYSLQIYYDFSGYSDIAIGCARCLGFKLKRNFDLPYISSSITEFWRRWHISLSSWFKDYVYIPLGGNRKGIIRQHINQLVVMTLSGLWHGASWNYVIWGLLNGIILCLEKAFGLNKNKKHSLLRMLLTFIVVSFTWIFFRAESTEKAFELLTAVFSLQEGVAQPYLWSFIALIIFVSYIAYTIIINKKNNNEVYEDNYVLLDLDSITGLTLFFIFVGLIMCLAYANTNPFVYFQF